MSVPYRRTVDDAWRRLRTLRHSPPGHAARGQRRELFSAALEQAEQFFRAADSVGYDTKPVMLYYGLSQASQAILAAQHDPKGQQSTTSHGVDCPNRAQIATVGDLDVCDARTGSGATPKGGAFQLLAGVLDSPTLPGPVQLRQLWISLPEGVGLPLAGGPDALFGAVLLERHDGRGYSDAFQDTLARVVKLANLPSSLMPLDVGDVQREIHERYPALAHFRVMRDERQCPEMAKWVMLLSPPGLRASLSFDREGKYMEHSEMHGLAEMGPRAYLDREASSMWLPPVLPGNAAPLHPLITWYAVLFGLSEQARYSPTTWARAININTSPDATALENLMDCAHLACANLIAGLFDVRLGRSERTGPRQQHYERVVAWKRANGVIN